MSIAKSLAKYPCIGGGRKMDAWEKMPENKGPRCCVCGGKALFKRFVEVNWFRGDDEGPFSVCRDHKEDAQAMLASRPAAPSGGQRE